MKLKTVVTVYQMLQEYHFKEIIQFVIFRRSYQINDGKIVKLCYNKLYAVIKMCHQNTIA